MKSLKEYFKARLSEDMAFDTAGFKASNQNVKRTQKAALDLSPLDWGNRNHPVRQAYDSALAQHVSLGGSDTVYTHDPATNTFKAITTLPQGLSDKLAADAMRWSNVSLSKKDAETAVHFANKLGGLHGTASWRDPELNPIDMNYSVLPGTSTNRKTRNGKRRVTKPSNTAIEWSRERD